MHPQVQTYDVRAELHELDPEKQITSTKRRASVAPDSPPAAKTQNAVPKRTDTGKPRRNAVTHNFSHSTHSRPTTGAKAWFKRMQTLQRRARFQNHTHTQQPPLLFNEPLEEDAVIQAQSIVNGASAADSAHPNELSQRQRSSGRTRNMSDIHDVAVSDNHVNLAGTATGYVDHAGSKCQWHTPKRQIPDDVVAQGNFSHDNLQDALQRLVGYNSFVGEQEEIIRRVLSGQSCLAVLSTASGKSLCYQLPALAMRGMTVVVCPLLALMKEQLLRMPQGSRGAVLASCQSRDQLDHIENGVENGDVDVLFLSPERLGNARIQAMLKRCSRGVSMVCVDEAHCVSEWSHNFRPAYFRLGGAIACLPGPPIVLALTATATFLTQASIQQSLGIPSEAVIRNSPLKSNIRFTVNKPLSRDRELLHLLGKTGAMSEGSVVVYSNFRSQCEHVAAMLNAAGVKATFYHAGMSKDQRESVQKRFATGRVRVCVATVAFGMGMDISTVSAVVHYSPPRSIEAFVQLSGRAGRDGEEARAHVMLSEEDYVRNRSMACCECSNKSSISRLLEHMVKTTTSRTMPQTMHADLKNSAVLDVGCIPVDQMSKSLEMSEEKLFTILCYLEHWGYIRLLPEITGSKCIFRSHMETLEALAEKHDIADAVLRLTGGKHQQGSYMVSVLQLSKELNVSLQDLQNELQECVKTKGISCELKERALTYTMLEPLQEHNVLADHLAHKLHCVEYRAVAKLDALQQLMSHAESYMESGKQDEVIRQGVHNQFTDENGLLVPNPQPPILTTLNEEVKLGVKADVATVLRCLKECGLLRLRSLSGKSVAKILHGVGSMEWQSSSRSKALKGLWGKHAHIDFAMVEHIARDWLATAAS